MCGINGFTALQVRAMPVRELDSELQPDHSEDIEETSQSQDIRGGNKNWCQCGLCSENEEQERDFCAVEK